MHKTDFFELFAIVTRQDVWPPWLKDWADSRPENRNALEIAGRCCVAGAPVNAIPLVDRIVESVNASDPLRMAADAMALALEEMKKRGINPFAKSPGR